MSQYLQYGGLKWVKVNNKVINRILNRSADSSYGYFLEVDLDYPEELHDSHKDFPMAPEKIKIKEELFSPYSRENAKKFDIKTGTINKLVPNTMAKEKYVGRILILILIQKEEKKQLMKLIKIFLNY